MTFWYFLMCRNYINRCSRERKLICWKIRQLLKCSKSKEGMVLQLGLQSNSAWIETLLLSPLLAAALLAFTVAVFAIKGKHFVSSSIKGKISEMNLTCYAYHCTDKSGRFLTFLTAYFQYLKVFFFRLDSSISFEYTFTSLMNYYSTIVGLF